MNSAQLKKNHETEIHKGRVASWLYSSLIPGIWTIPSYTLKVKEVKKKKYFKAEADEQ